MATTTSFRLTGWEWGLILLTEAARQDRLTVEILKVAAGDLAKVQR